MGVKDIFIHELSPEQVASVRKAAELIRAGGVVAIPTETVYGLGADCKNDAAVRRIFEVKGRPSGHPLIVHISALADLKHYAREIPEIAWVLAEKFWPGPLTIILRRSAVVPDAVTGGLDTVGLRVPAHPLTLALIRESGCAIAAPSANRFGSVSPTSAEHVKRDLGNAVDYVLDGGPCSIGIESTIVDLSSGVMRVLRPGAVTLEQLQEASGQTQAAGEEAGSEAAAVRAPGMLRSHYSPKAEVILVEAQELAASFDELRAAGRRPAILGSELEGLGSRDRLELPQTLEGQAHDLYSALRQADELGFDAVLACLPAETGLGLALADRLRRAAGQGESPDDT